MADDNKLGEIPFLVGVKLSAQGRHAEAVKAYEQVEPNDPNFLQAQMNLKWISYWTGSVHDEFVSQDQNRWQPGKKLFSNIVSKRD